MSIFRLHKMRTAVLILAFACCTFAAPKSARLGPPTSRIVGGTKAARGEFPYQISYQTISDENPFRYLHSCGGTIIAEDWILTTANCVTLSKFDPDRVVAGILNVYNEDDEDDAPTRQVVQIASRIVHENFTLDDNPLHPRAVPNDIALLHLETPLTWNDAVQPIALPPAGVEPSGVGIFAGWGSTNNGLWPIMPDFLQKAELPIIPYIDCKQALDNMPNISHDLQLDSASNLCTGPLTEDVAVTNSGDAGGALAQNGTLIGIDSWGVRPDGYPIPPRMFTKISNFVDWIETHINRAKVNKA